MRFNEKELKELAAREAIIQGIMQYMKPQSDWYQQPVYKERIFKLVNNFLFYYRVNEQEEPLGVFALESMEVAYESPGLMAGPAFTFSMRFNDGKHIFACRCQEDLNRWVAALKVASYTHLRSQHEVLLVKLARLKGTNNFSTSKKQLASKTTKSTSNDNNYQKIDDVNLITRKMSKSTFYSSETTSYTIRSAEKVETSVVIDNKTKTNNSTNSRSNNVPVDNLIDL